MTETRRLLREYVEAGSESAFRELVERYIDLVYSTALRLVAGDSHRAEDVAQTVFVRLMRRAETLNKEVSLGGWLHRDTCYVATTMMRGERRRQNRERQAVEMNTLHDEPDPNLTNVLPILDEAINELGNEDREAIMLRFFEQQSFRALGEIVGSSEDAARMRVNRALEKLQGLLRARGVAAISIGGLTTVLGAKAVSAAPIGLAANVVKGLGAGVTGGGASSPAVIKPLAKSLKLALVPAVLVVILSAGIYAGHRAANKTASTPGKATAIASIAPVPVAPAVPQAEASVAAETANAPTNIMEFHVIDAASGAPLAAAKVSVGYFPSREGKGAHLETDDKGVARVDLPQSPYTSANIFVTAAGHAPMTTSLHEGETFPTNYIMKMAAGTTIGGVVVDEQQQPVANVTIEFSGPGIDMAKKENIEFGPDTKRYTDENGRWWSDTIPAEFDEVTVLLTHPEFAATITNISVNGADAASMVLVIQKGILVKGTVTDQSGQPIPGASIRQVQNHLEPMLSAKSDGAGHFQLGRLNPSELALAVEADGFCPMVLDTTVSNNPLELGFKLAPGHILRGRVVDESGVPVANATIKTATDNYGVRKFKWSGTTDKQGRFEWSSAPAEEVSCSVEADGFAGSSQSLQAGETEQEITLARPRSPASNFVRLRGTVIDTDTGQPVDNFNVLIGAAYPAGFSMPPQFRFATDGRDGHFDFRNNMIYMMGPAYQLEIQKEGYAPVVSTNLSVKDGDQILVFNLHKDAGLGGDVLLPSGEPATNATIFLYGRQGGVYMDKPGEYRKDRNISAATRTQADAHGHFSFATILDARGFIVIADEGYAEVPIGSFEGKIVLQPWGRVEGKLTAGGQPATGEKICVSQVLYRYPGNDRMFAPLQLWLETTTDSEGNFVFEKVPPGERLISHRLTQAFSGTGRLYDAQQKPIVVASGTVTQVELGGSGRVVTGRGTFTAGAEPVKWQEVAAELSLKITDGLEKPPKREDYPSQDAFVAALQAHSKANREFWSSEKGHELERSHRSYAAYCAKDGSFSIPDVPPGQYDLKIDIRRRSGADPNEIEGREVGLLDQEINVPESDGGKEHEVLDLGTLDVPTVKVSSNGF